MNTAISTCSGRGRTVVTKRFGYFETLGHATSLFGARTVFSQACPSQRDHEVRVAERAVRVDGIERPAYVVERAA